MRVFLTAIVNSVAAAQTTWVVDDTPGPGVHFTSLPAAVAAAASGDTAPTPKGASGSSRLKIFGTAVSGDEWRMVQLLGPEGAGGCRPRTIGSRDRVDAGGCTERSSW